MTDFDSMYCPNCKKTTWSAYPFCSECGTDVRDWDHDYEKEKWWKKQ